MKTETCQNCKKDFIIEPEDFLFYEKIKVPPPTFCPHCRLVRRLIWRNERSLFKRNCSLCKKNIISTYDDTVSFPVYCNDCYKSDKWEASEFYQEEYDFSKSFFDQWKDLFNKVPRPSLWQDNCVDSLYSNYVLNSKNIYLGYSVLNNSEDVSYSSTVDNSKQIVDSYSVTDSDFAYESMGVNKNYHSKYSYWSSGCIDCCFLLDCNNCHDCFGCVNLNNKSYCVWNEQYSKEEYDIKIKNFNMGSFDFVRKINKDFWDFSLMHPRRYSRMVNSIDSTGDELRNSNNVKNCFIAYDNENVKYAYRIFLCKDSMDVCHCNASLSYEHALAGSLNGSNLKFIINGASSINNLEYCDLCKSSNDLFACIGLKNKKFFILNKQYEKDEYFEMVEKIKKHMDEMPYVDNKGIVYKYGEFFPCELCPFGYNQSIINDHFPLSKEEILKIGYLYKEKELSHYIITKYAKDLPDHIKDVDDSILEEVIECEISKKAFKIVKSELEFYRKMNIPLPRIHPDERYKERMKLRNPMILYHRNCMKEGCINEFETTYDPNKPEIVYCKNCYQGEIF